MKEIEFERVTLEIEQIKAKATKARKATTFRLQTFGLVAFVAFVAFVGEKLQKLQKLQLSDFKLLDLYLLYLLYIPCTRSPLLCVLVYVCTSYRTVYYVSAGYNSRLVYTGYRE